MKVLSRFASTSFTSTRLKTRLLQTMRTCLFGLFTAGLVFVIFVVNSRDIKHFVSTSTNRLRFFDVRLFASPDEGGNRILMKELNLLADDDPALLSTQFDGSECSLDVMNSKRLQQNHPCVIDIIRRNYLYPPADRDLEYDLFHPDVADPSMGQSALRRKHFGNQTNGFFVECGAFDGENHSNTLFMERFQNWTGILIEPNSHSFTQIIELGRKSHSLPVCLSPEPYPTRVRFNSHSTIGSIYQPNISDPINLQRRIKRLMTVQCFPLYSILLAVGQTRVDFFSLDVEGYELRILKTIPWHKVDIKSLTIEWLYVGQKNLTDLLEPLGYYVFAKNEKENHQDLLFAKKEPRLLPTGS